MEPAPTETQDAPPIRLRYTAEEALYRRALALCYRDMRWSWIGFFLVLIMLVGAGVCVAFGQLTGPAIMVGVLFVLLPAVLLQGSLLTAYMLPKYRKLPGFGREMEVTLTPKKFASATVNGRSELEWEIFSKVVWDGHVILLYPNSSAYLFIPRETLAPEAFAAFERWVRAKVRVVKVYP